MVKNLILDMLNVTTFTLLDIWADCCYPYFTFSFESSKIVIRIKARPQNNVEFYVPKSTLALYQTISSEEWIASSITVETRK